jgi:hypothetical protein
MTKSTLFWFLLLALILPSEVYAQKVKYKDIFALLSTKQYEQAEPFLRRYLKENDDNANAYLFMGIIFQEKAQKTDILKQTPLALLLMDSAIFYYDKTLPILDEREVRKNKEYYISYNRRDLRTGEFGVKHSDVQFDLEKRKEGLREKIDKVKMINHYFDLSDTLYKKINYRYKELQAQYPSERHLYLRSDSATLQELKLISARFDSCTKAFETYKSSSANLGSKTGYGQVMEMTDINDFSNDGTSLADFYEDQLTVWNYKKFAEKAIAVIEKEILPMRKHLISYDIEINKLRDKLNTDSISVTSDLTKLIDRILYDQLKKYDPDPLPMEVFSLKTADLEYRSIVMDHKPLLDSSDVHLKLRLIQKEQSVLNKLDSIGRKLMAVDLDKKALDYADFVENTYGSSAVLKSYISTLTEYAEREKSSLHAGLAQRLKALNWIVDGTDSIPLLGQSEAHRYKPLFTSSEKYTVGLHFKDSLTAMGYFYTVNASRKPEVKVMFPVEKTSFKQRALPTTKSISYADAAGQIFFVAVYSEKPVKEKYALTLAKIYRSDGLAWSNNYQLTFIPKEVTLKPDTGEITLKNDVQQTVIDKNGKQISK